MAEETINDRVRKVERVSEGGNMLANLALIDANTWQTSAEVYADRQRGEEVEGVNTANLAVYRIGAEGIEFELLGRKGNPFLDEDIKEDAYTGILDMKFFHPAGRMKKHIKKDKRRINVKYSRLKIKTDGCGKDDCYVEFDDYGTAEEKKLFNSVYGTDNPGNGKRVYLLRAEVVREDLNWRTDELIVRACYLANDQNFYANDWFLCSRYYAVYGIRLKKLPKTTH